MTDEAGKPMPHFTPAAEAARLARLAREAAALRANLRRRKAQVQARSEAGLPATDHDPEVTRRSEPTDPA